MSTGVRYSDIDSYVSFLILFSLAVIPDPQAW
jgi:hypothetical protein